MRKYSSKYRERNCSDLPPETVSAMKKVIFTMERKIKILQYSEKDTSQMDENEMNYWLQLAEINSFEELLAHIVSRFGVNKDVLGFSYTLDSLIQDIRHVRGIKNVVNVIKYQHRDMVGRE